MTVYSSMEVRDVRAMSYPPCEVSQQHLYPPVDQVALANFNQRREPSSLYTKLWMKDPASRSAEAFVASTCGRRTAQQYYDNDSVYNPANPRYSQHFESLQNTAPMCEDNPVADCLNRVLLATENVPLTGNLSNDVDMDAEVDDCNIRADNRRKWGSAFENDASQNWSTGDAKRRRW